MDKAIEAGRVKINPISKPYPRGMLKHSEPSSVTEEQYDMLYTIKTQVDDVFYTYHKTPLTRSEEGPQFDLDRSPFVEAQWSSGRD